MATTGKQDSVEKYLLIGRCEDDSSVKFPFYWSEEIIEEAKKLGFNVIDLKRENFTEEKFTRHITEKNPSFIFLNGHGDEICAMGHNRQPVLTLNKNDYLLKGKIAHIISCKTGLWLGQFAIDKGCKGYIGYQGLFHIKNIHPEPNQDVISKMFMKVVNETSKMLLQNMSVIDVFKKSQEIYDENIKICQEIYFDISLPDLQRDFISGVMSALEENKRNQIFHI